MKTYARANNGALLMVVLVSAGLYAAIEYSDRLSHSTATNEAIASTQAMDGRSLAADSNESAAPKKSADDNKVVREGEAETPVSAKPRTRTSAPRPPRARRREKRQRRRPSRLQAPRATKCLFPRRRFPRISRYRFRWIYKATRSVE